MKAQLSSTQIDNQQELTRINRSCEERIAETEMEMDRMQKQYEKQNREIHTELEIKKMELSQSQECFIFYSVLMKCL